MISSGSGVMPSDSTGGSAGQLMLLLLFKLVLGLSKPEVP